MFYSCLSVTNPWYKKREGTSDYKSLFVYHGKLLKHKYWECEAIKDKQKLLGAELSFSWRNRDHAGLEIGFCLLGLDIAFRIYDIRHWDHKTNDWVKIEQNINH